MPARLFWRPPWYAWASLGVAALALSPVLAPRLTQGSRAIALPLLVLVGVLAMRWLWEQPPAVTMCAAVALRAFSGGWRYFGLGGLPLDRLLVVIVLLQLLLRAPGVASTPRLQARNVHLLLCLTLMYALASAVSAGTLGSEAGFLALVDQFGVVPFLMFLVAPAIFAGQRERDMLLWTLLGLGAYLGFTAIFESLGPHALVFPHYIAQVDRELPGERAGGPFQSSVAEGFATFACAVAAVMAYARWHDRARRYFAAVVAVVCAAGCFVTLERGVWVAAVAATLITALVSRAGRRWLVPGAVLCGLAIGGALLVSPTLSHKTSQRANDEQSIWDRKNQTSAGLRMLQAKPLLGFGWQRYTKDSLDYFRQADTYPMRGYTIGETIASERPLPLHNTYLAYAVELGLLGALLWLASLLWGLGGAIFTAGPPELRPWKLGLLAITIFFLVVAAFNPYQQAFPTFLLWVWGGVALGRAPAVARAKSQRAPALRNPDPAWLTT